MTRDLRPLSSFDSQMRELKKRKLGKAAWEKRRETIAKMKHLFEDIYLCKQKVSLIP